MKRLLVILPFLLAGALCAVATHGAEEHKKIVLIGGPKSHGTGEHDFPNGIVVLRELLKNSPAARGVAIDAYPNGWPLQSSFLDGASTVVFYFDGVQNGDSSHPLFNPEHRAFFEKLMERGVGVVALHQASTTSVDDHTINLPRWLGGARYGMFDRTTELVEFDPNRASPISNGVGRFSLFDEYYPTIRFNAARPVMAILTGNLHPQYRDGAPRVIDKAETHPVAWSYERENGGRAFTFTGLHYLEGLDEPHLRKLLLNAILWTAKVEVPEGGVTTTAPADAAVKLVSKESEAEQSPAKTIRDAIVVRRADDQVIQYPWGHLTWYVSRELKSSDTLTVGEAVIKPGKENPRHYHPNCDEVLHVVKGHILHSMGNNTAEMTEGDTVSIPAGIRHNAKNIGTEDAVLAISFSSADRQVVGE